MIVNPASNPSTVPAPARRADCTNTMRSTADVVAPSAIRIPISCLRCPNVYVSTPYRPEMLKASAMALSRVPMYDAARIGNNCSSTISSIGKTSKAAGSRVTRCSVVRTTSSGGD